ncbi:MAG: matrixin family metalloprotease [Planctomycetes bacterium]|nr:matrixin family metalloprotease [Planctomycetota bacterium]
MRRCQKITFSMLFACLFLPVLSAKADISAAAEWVDIPVVVNIIDASDANNVDDAIKKANDILAGAHIRLIVKKTNKNVNVGNNDGDLTADEGNTAQGNGETELRNVAGAGKGIKITIADDVWTEESATNGWSIHRNPVVFAETDDPNTMGNVIAHEIGHSLTINGHSNDPNNVMYPTTPRGVNWDPNDVNEIFTNAKKRGTAYFIVPGTLGPGDDSSRP